MIPTTISWTYQRQDITSAHSHGIANSTECALDDISLKSLIPSETGDFVMFLCTIIKSGEQNYILTVLKTNENISDDEFIPKGSYYSYYLIPSKIEVQSSNLTIYDMFKNDLYIELDIENVFSKSRINRITLPNNTFVFN